MKLLSLIALLLVTISSVTAQVNDTSYFVYISVKDTLNLTEFAGVFINNTSKPIEIDYEMELVRTSISGTSKQLQCGAHIVGPHKVITLSRSLLNLPIGSECIVNLKVCRGDSVIKIITYQHNN